MGVLATVAPDGTPRLVPVCFALRIAGLTGAAGDRADPIGPILYVPIDEKPKRSADPRALARVRDILQRPAVSLLFERWDEDWSRLAWLRLRGRASLLEPEGRDGAGAPGAAAGQATGEHAAAVVALRARYPQYREHRLETLPLIRIVVERAVSWGRLGPDLDAPGTGTPR